MVMPKLAPINLVLPSVVNRKDNHCLDQTKQEKDNYIQKEKKKENSIPNQL
jgi:hypothetical protein